MALFSDAHNVFQPLHKQKVTRYLLAYFLCQTSGNLTNVVMTKSILFCLLCQFLTISIH